MQPWLVRGCVMAVVYAAAETVLAKVQVTAPGAGSVLDPVVLALLVGVGLLWGGIDGWLRRPRAGMQWFYAGLLGGLLAGVISVTTRALFVDQTGVWALGSALTGDAAFIALLIMLPGALGVAVGGRLQPPDGTRQGRRWLRSAPRG
ncbi:MAG TPA: B-4DMT family transporter [Pseudonocardiaceae bacterium]|nr:B-4DMT family transporter [Pseudonocardiaceae bacterium]